jgi:hypothetical protein
MEGIVNHIAELQRDIIISAIQQFLRIADAAISFQPFIIVGVVLVVETKILFFIGYLMANLLLQVLVRD